MTQATEDSGAVSVEEFVGSAFGDLSTAEPSESGSAGDAAPAPPDAPAAEPPAPAPESDAPPATPAESPTPDVPPADPLAEATPFTYMVDGQSKTYEGIRVLGEDGAIVEPAALADLAQKLSRVDHLTTANAQLYQRIQQIESLGGEQAFAKLNEEFAQVNAAGSLLVPLIAGDVNNVLKLLQRDETGAISWNEEARQLLLGNIDLATKRAQMTAQTEFTSRIAKGQSTGQQTQHAEQARMKGMTEAELTVRQYYPDFQPADYAALKTHLTTYADYLIRPASAADVKQFPQLQQGQMFIDYPRLQPWLTERQAMRQAAKQTTTTVEKATKENAARLAAAVRPTKASPTNAPPASNPQGQESDDKWDLMEKLALASIRTKA